LDVCNQKSIIIKVLHRIIGCKTASLGMWSTNNPQTVSAEGHRAVEGHTVPGLFLLGRGGRGNVAFGRIHRNGLLELQTVHPAETVSTAVTLEATLH